MNGAEKIKLMLSQKFQALDNFLNLISLESDFQSDVVCRSLCRRPSSDD